MYICIIAATFYANALSAESRLTYRDHQQVQRSISVEALRKGNASHWVHGELLVLVRAELTLQTALGVSAAIAEARSTAAQRAEAEFRRSSGVKSGSAGTALLRGGREIYQSIEPRAVEIVWAFPPEPRPGSKGASKKQR